MQKVNEIFGFSSPKQLTTLDNKTLREEAATTLANLYPHDLEKDELAVEIESFKYSVIGSDNLAGRVIKSKLNATALEFLNYLYTTGLHENYSNLTTALRIYLTTSFCRLE
ncbi:hypothetical protein AVEN_239966-1 [Araneus ventricosus]|uniref:Uncharacterized protein n=1 Tax=Araneus ventricosus TaxID=182803 RepID=A0A4Y2U8Y2_ARAVE|nr:hypothetical protein AVEN_239966-1 [Araneus ventricosus]